mmetsp:Transcript_15211/g.21356  ORF Transcript_15211/g.21356 Transcript_15211/m.21356 type:complete len:144 (+) Transcript_15211:291-722(+)|eukprot:CAMPEP_0184479966 /NCGR_PEP_ID=MMETSP0113_2-20130426/1476_1 /TAXON_ID=91329 /ORGANISM="Norrisiella sphaerica, Strain BC52" /LENGTH=143 /DNA_ID=CAMNT_0026858143 /DNA_START=291 /DNA_END=722 /DNA_ORIENTATION=+
MEGMNALVDAFPTGFTCLGIFSNQFGHQTNESNSEILNTIAHVRPGNGFKCKFDLFAKTDVNGAEEMKLFTFLKDKLPVPSGTASMNLMSNPGSIIWGPVKRSDIAWNFEKFLINKDGIPVKRYSSKTPSTDINKDIAALLKK